MNIYNDFSEGGAYLNLGGGKYNYVGAESWKLIRLYVVKATDRSAVLKDDSDYRRYFKN